MKSNLQAIIQHIEHMNKLFYQQYTSEAFTELDQVLTLLMQVMEELFTYQFENDSLERDKIELNNILIKAMNAIEKKDAIMIADIFQHELLKLLLKMKEVHDIF